MFFTIIGGSGVVLELEVLSSVIVEGSIEELTFEFVKLESGIITRGYPALLQHLAMLVAASLMLALAVHSFVKIIKK